MNMTDETGGDNTDETGCLGQFCDRKFKTEFKPVALSGRIDDYDDYIMEYPKRGKCYIFNHTFEGTDDARDGADVDVARLFCRFKSLGFEVEVFPDLTVKEVEEKLEEAGKGDYRDESCFVCCVLSHGVSGFLFAKDGIYPTEKVFAPFLEDVCPSLKGKPKMFFIQACQGKNTDSGVLCNERLDAEFCFKIPTDPDFLIVTSSFPGFYSWRNTTNGSWFIQALCAGVEEHAKNKDFLSILTIVNRKVAFDFESCTRKKDTNEKKQVPFVISTLTRNIRFP